MSDGLNPALEEARFCPRCGQPADVAYPRSISCPHCGYGAYYNPKPVAAAIPVTRDDKIVLLRRGFDPGKGLWTFPGGFVDLGEIGRGGGAQRGAGGDRGRRRARRPGGRVLEARRARRADRLRRDDRRHPADHPRGATGRRPSHPTRSHGRSSPSGRRRTRSKTSSRVPDPGRAAALAAIVDRDARRRLLRAGQLPPGPRALGRHDPAQRLPRPQGRARRLRAARRLGRALRGDPAARAAARRPAHDRPRHGQDGRGRPPARRRPRPQGGARRDRDLPAQPHPHGDAVRRVARACSSAFAVRGGATPQAQIHRRHGARDGAGDGGSARRSSSRPAARSTTRSTTPSAPTSRAR